MATIIFIFFGTVMVAYTWLEFRNEKKIEKKFDAPTLTPHTKIEPSDKTTGSIKEN